MNKSKPRCFTRTLHCFAFSFYMLCRMYEDFAHAGVIIKNTQVLNQAVSVSQTAAEYYKASNADLVLRQKS